MVRYGTLYLVQNSIFFLPAIKKRVLHNLFSEFVTIHAFVLQLVDWKTCYLLNKY